MAAEDDGDSVASITDSDEEEVQVFFRNFAAAEGGEKNRHFSKGAKF